MNALAAPRAFFFEAAPVRAIVRDDEPWFVGKDVCAALGHGNHKQALARLDDDERDGVQIVDPIGRQQTITVISEPGVYRLVFTSRTERAEAFKRWLAHEVLPALRRTGRYEPEPEPDPEALPTSAEGRLWGVPIPNLMAAARIVHTIRSIYGPEHARRAWESEPSLPQVIPRPGACGSDMFLSARTEPGDGDLPAGALYGAYLDWCAARGEPADTATRFGRACAARYAKRRGSVVVYQNVRLRPETPEVPEPPE